MPAPKRQLNLRFLTWLLAPMVLLGALAAAVWYAQVQMRIVPKLRTDALSEVEEDRKALDLLKRYLTFKPDDVEALRKYGFLVERSGQTADERAVALPALERSLAREDDPELIRKLRLAIANIKLAKGLALAPIGGDDAPENRRNIEASRILCTEAADQLQRVIDRDTKANVEITPKERAELHTKLGDAYRIALEPDKAVKAYEDAIAAAPDESVAYARLAYVIREKQKDRTDGPKEADAQIEAMVTRNPGDPKAYLLRALYNDEYNPPPAAGPDTVGADLAKALELGPDDPDVLVAAATHEIAKPRNAGIEQARRYLEHAIKKHPARPVPYIIAAELERGDQPNVAEQTLQEALRSVPRDDQGYNDLLWALANVLIDSGQIDKWDAHRKALVENNFPPALIGYLDARKLIAEKQWVSARSKLESIRPSLEMAPKIAGEADYALALCYERAENDDKAPALRVAALRSAARLLPDSIRIRTALAKVLADTEGVDAALGAIKDAGSSSVDALLLRIQLTAEATIRKPPSQRDWTPVEALLDEFPRVAGPDTVQEMIARVAVARARDEDPKNALALLARSIADHPTWPEPRVLKVSILQAQGRQDEALAALVEAQRQLPASPEIFEARLAYWLRRADPKTRPALAAMTAEIAGLPEAQRDQLAERLAIALSRSGAGAEALALWKKMAADQPRNSRLQAALFDQAYRNRDDATMTQAIESLTRLEGEKEPLVIYARAAQLVARARTATGDAQTDLINQARGLVSRIQPNQPGYNRVPLIEAEIADIRNQPDEAIKAYKAAIDRGEKQPAIVRRYVELLYSKKLYTEADQAIKDLTQAGGLDTATRRMQAEISAANRDEDRALQFAMQAIPPDSKDFGDFIWLGRIYLALNRPDEAEKQYQKATQVAPDAPEPWIALTQFYMRARRPDEAEKTLERAATNLPTSVAARTLAQGYDVLGRTDRATELFDKALKAAPDDPMTLRLAAAHSLGIGRFDRAEADLRKILSLPNAKTDAPWARRTLALALNRPDARAEQRREADTLIEANLRENPRSTEDLRTKAILLAQRPDQRAQAIDLFRDLEKSQALDPGDTTLLALLLEAEQRWDEASQRLLAASADYPANADLVAALVRGLIRQGKMTDAGFAIDRLQKLEPAEDSPRTAILQARILRALKQEERAAQPLRNLLTKASTLPSERVVEILRELEKIDPAGAEAGYLELAKSLKPPVSDLVVAGFLARQKRAAEALDRLDAARKADPDAAPSIVAEAINTLNIAEPSTDAFRRVESWIAQLPPPAPGGPDPAILRGHLLAVEGNTDQAKTIYRAILKKTPDDPMALNNLAWLIALTGPAQELDEALQDINRAIDDRGKLPSLLDTRAIVHLARNDPKAAIDDLNLALKSKHDATYFYHLARAQLAAGLQEAARNSLARAEGLDFEVSSLDRLERPEYEKTVARIRQSAP